jgi:hypothetical protein
MCRPLFFRRPALVEAGFSANRSNWLIRLEQAYVVPAASGNVSGRFQHETFCAFVAKNRMRNNKSPQYPVRNTQKNLDETADNRYK